MSDETTPTNGFDMGVAFYISKITELKERLDNLSFLNKPSEYFDTLDDMENKQRKLMQLRRRRKFGLI